MESPLRHDALFHTGIVVDDLAAAKEQLGAEFGVTWYEGGGEVLLVTADGAEPTATSYVLSQEGPHHLELVQSVPGTLYTPAPPTSPGPRAHHLGYWVDDVQSASAALEAAGVPLHTSMCFGRADAPPICAYHLAGGEGESAFYLELVSRKMRKVLLPDG